MANNTKVTLDLLLNDTQFKKSIDEAITVTGQFAAGFAALSLGTDILTDIGAAAIDLSLDFEQSFAKVSTLFGGVQVDTELLEQKIFDLSNTTGVATTELNEGLYSALSAGIPVTEDMTEAMDFLEKATQLSIAGFTSTEKAVDVATTVLNAYGLEVSDTDRVMNTLIETQNAGKTTVDELASSIGKAIPGASQLGVNFEELSASLAVTTANGIGTSESVTMMSALFKEMNDNGSAVNDMFRELNGTSIDEFIANGGDFQSVLEILNEGLEEQNKKWGDILTSSESVTAAQTLMKDGGEELSEVYARMTDDTMELTEAYDKMQTPQQNINKIQETWHNTLTDIGNTLMDLFNPALEWLAENMEWLAPIIAGVAIVTGILLVVFGLAAIAAGILTLGLIPLALGFIVAALPVILLAVLIGVLIFAFYKAAEATGELGDIIQIFKEIATIAFLLVGIALYLLWAVFSEVFARIQETMESFLEFFEPEIELIKTILGDVTDFLLAVIQGDWEKAFDIAANIVETFVTYFSTRFPIISDIVSDIVGMILAMINGDWDLAWKYAKSSVQGFLDYFNKHFPEIGSVMQNVVDLISAIINGDWAAAWEAFKKIPISMINALIGGIESGLNYILSGITDFVNSVSVIANKVPGVNIPEVSAPAMSLPRIPYFAKGGIVDGAGLGVIGEAGPEMILPLNNQGAEFLQSAFGSSKFGTSTVINFDMTVEGSLVAQDPKQLRRDILNDVDEFLGQNLGKVRNT